MARKRILITHIDLDGAGCAILFKNKFPDIEVQYHNYDTIEKITEKLWDTKDDYDEIYFADITPTEKFGIQMIDDPKFTLIDHHKSRTYLEGTPWFTIHECGAYISYLFLYRGLYDIQSVVPDFICAVNAYDMWDLTSAYRNYGLDLNLLFDYYGMDKFVEEFIDMRDINKEEEIIIKILEKLEIDYLNKKLEQGKIKIDEYNNVYFKVYVGEYRGNLGALVTHPDFPKECKYIKVININDSTAVLYSTGFDVTPICEAKGGGGHKTAAGYQLTPW